VPGEAIGMLSVGILENTYTATRDRVILSFFGIATIGFLLILGITYYMIRNITRPIGELVAAWRKLSARPRAAATSALVWNLDPELPRVMADRSQFQQVFINILMNAVQAMNEGGTIAIATRPDGSGDTVEVAISDSGRGTGLGWSIAYGIVTTHRGTISVHSEVGKGTTFTIRMPAAAEETLRV
jgi:signal transduction histidine kinase